MIEFCNFFLSFSAFPSALPFSFFACSAIRIAIIRCLNTEELFLDLRRLCWFVPHSTLWDYRIRLLTLHLNVYNINFRNFKIRTLFYCFSSFFFCSWQECMFNVCLVSRESFILPGTSLPCPTGITGIFCKRKKSRQHKLLSKQAYL